MERQLTRKNTYMTSAKRLWQKMALAKPYYLGHVSFEIRLSASWPCYRCYIIYLQTISSYVMCVKGKSTWGIFCTVHTAHLCWGKIFYFGVQLCSRSKVFWKSPNICDFEIRHMASFLKSSCGTNGRFVSLAIDNMDLDWTLRIRRKIRGHFFPEGFNSICRKQFDRFRSNLVSISGLMCSMFSPIKMCVTETADKFVRVSVTGHL